MRFSFVIALAAVALGGTAAASRAGPVISINIGVEPACPYGYYDYPRMPVRRMATTVPSGSPVECSSALAHGSTAQVTFTAM